MDSEVVVKLPQSSANPTLGWFGIKFRAAPDKVRLSGTASARFAIALAASRTRPWHVAHATA
jgi:hypothetical protein